MAETVVVPLTGIEEIDQQHRQMVKNQDDLQDYLGSSYSFAAVFTALNTLMDYTRFHFTFEEQLLAQWNYPHLENHVAEHKLIADNVAALWDKIEAGQEIDDQMVHTIRGWILEHIKAEDLQYAGFLSGAPAP